MAAWNPAGIVLAAGRSVRFGRDKRLEVVDGQPMLLRAADLLKRVVADTVVVLGPQDFEHAALLERHGISSVICPDAHLGMGRSLAYAVGQRADAAGWLIMPADLPYMRPDTVTIVLDAARRHELAAPVHAGRRGHPVWFSRRFGPELCALSGDEGARSILRAQAATAGQPQGLALIDVPDQGCVLDIDTLQDLQG
ncbi:MAG: nucleotidyltransferase family protein [Burkholderiaceae bacterium]